MGDFYDGVKKISYAVSIGLPDIPMHLREEYQRNLLKFDAVSVREEEGADLLKKYFGTKAQTVLDPTLLLDAGEYRKIKKKLKTPDKTGGKYIACYFLKEQNTYGDTVKAYAKEKKMNIAGYTHCEENKHWMQHMDAAGPGEFLSLIDKADTVFTDSYHGAIFSLLFHKEFYLFPRFSKNDPLNQNSRIRQLQKWFGIDRIIESYQDIKHCRKLDYSDFEVRLSQAGQLSKKFMEESLAGNAVFS